MPVLAELQTEASILFLHYPSRKKQTIRVNVQSLKTIEDLKRELANRLVDETESDDDDDIVDDSIEIAIVKQGRIERVLQSSEHVLATMTGKDERVVAYHIPSSARSDYIVQVLQTKPIDNSFVPFNLYFREKEVPGQAFFEQVAGSYIFTTQRLNDLPFKLRLCTPTYIDRSCSIIRGDH
jgi:hypothetical protein